MNTNVMIKLNAASFRDKVYACWIGKNICGTMGAPFEGKREYLDVRGFTTAEGVVLPNDDLDLQLVWLHAVEQLGPRAINAATLGEFWLSYIVPHWNEYGLGKNNMVRGLLSPLSMITIGVIPTVRGSVPRFGPVWHPAVPILLPSIP